MARRKNDPYITWVVGGFFLVIFAPVVIFLWLGYLLLKWIFSGNSETGRFIFVLKILAGVFAYAIFDAFNMIPAVNVAISSLIVILLFIPWANTTDIIGEIRAGAEQGHQYFRSDKPKEPEVTDEFGQIVPLAFTEEARENFERHRPKGIAKRLSKEELVSSEQSIPTAPKPPKNPFGVSHEGAEHYVAAWLKYLGHTSVEVTQYSGDKGIDVSTATHIAQVKNYKKSNKVSSGEIRDLAGAVMNTGKKPVFFSSSEPTPAALTWANDKGIPVILFSAVEGEVRALNSAGRTFLKLYVD